MASKRKNWNHLPWDTIRDAYIVGVKASELSKRYGCPAGTISSRAMREEWPTPKRVQQKVAKAYYQMMADPSDKEKILDDLGSLATGLDPSMSTTEIRQRLRARAEKHMDFVSSLAVEKITKAKIAAPKTWKELDLADRIARRSLGLDQKEPEKPVQIGIMGPAQVVDLAQSRAEQGEDGENGED